MSDTVAVNAVATSFGIVEYMAGYGSALGVSEIAHAVDAKRSLVFRHLRTLVKLGYVAQDSASEKYALTPRLFHLGQSVADQMDFLAAARRVAPDLARAVKLAVSIGQVEQRGVRVLDLLRHRSFIEITTPPGALFDFATSAQGKVALAFTPGLWARKFVKEQEVLGANDRPVDIERLAREVEAVRDRGWGASSGEVLAGVSALAAPIFDGRSMLVGTIAVIGSSQVIPASPPPEIVHKLVEAAQRISKQLGYREEEAAP